MIALAFIWVDSSVLGIFNENIYKILLLCSILAPAVQPVIIANLFDARPSQSSYAFGGDDSGVNNIYANYDNCL